MVERQVRPLEEMADFRSGGTPSKSDPAFWNGDIPWLTPKDMRRYVGRTVNCVTEEAIGNGTRLAPSGCTFIAVRGMSLHQEIRIARSVDPIAFNQDVKAIVPGESVDSEFLYYALLSKKRELLNSVEAAGHGTGRLPTDILETLEMPDLDLPEQRKLARLFSALDRRIDLNEQMSEGLEKMVQALFRDWFVEFGPTRAKAEGCEPYHSPEVWALFPDVLDDEDKPLGWAQRSVHSIANFVNGAVYKNMHFSPERAGLPVIKIAELKNGVKANTKFTETELGEKYRIGQGEILFSWSGNPDTSIDAFVWDDGAAWLNQHIFRVRENGLASRPMIYFQLKVLKSVFAELARNKQTTGLGHVTVRDMKELMICDPPKEVANVFDSVAGPIFEKILANRLESRTLATVRDLMLPKFMSGEIQLKEAEKVVEAVA